MAKHQLTQMQDMVLPVGDTAVVLSHLLTHRSELGKATRRDQQFAVQLPGASTGDVGRHDSNAKSQRPGFWKDTRRTCIFSVDVEDWFHILDVPSSPDISEWGSLPLRVEKNFLSLLDLFSEKEVRVTCFFLGWVAEKYPHLVKEADHRGHEIASHGYSHKLVYQLGQQEFFRDATKSKVILESIVGHQIFGYRAPGFSVTENTPWFFDTLMKAGYSYDSSLFPASRGHGGLRMDYYAPFLVGTNSNLLIEFPITVTEVFGRPICFFGGGYFRLFPYGLIKKMASRVLKEGRPVVFYVHPREVDPFHPRLSMKFTRRFKSYVNVKTTEAKIRRVLADFEVGTFQSFITNNLMCNTIYSVKNKFLNTDFGMVHV